MSEIDTLIAELRAGLEGTTPGEWKTRVHAESTKPDAVVSDGRFVARCQPLFGRPHHDDEACENARHIALASPQNLRALLDHIDRLELSPRPDVLIAERNAAEARAEAAEKERDEAVKSSDDAQTEIDDLTAECEEHCRRADKAEAELARLRRGEAVADWSDAPCDLYVTELRKVDPVVWEGSVCNVPMALAPEVRYVRADIAEAKLARLRAPVMEGEVGDCLAKLNNRKVNEPDFGMRLRHEAADLLQRLAGQVAEARERTEREVSATRADAWAERTARIAAEARLREAVEAMRPFAVHGEYVDFHFPDDGDDVVAAGLPDNPITLGHFRRARAFLSTLKDHSNG